MIRPARFIDVPVLVDMLADLHPKSIYADYGEVDRNYARKLLASAAQKHGGIHNGATCLFVAEDGKGVICGFVAGALSPVYHIGTRLVAQDIYLIVTEGQPLTVLNGLIDAYVGWAIASPKVLEVNLSRTDALPTGPRMDKIIIRKGFEPCGRLFRRLVNVDEARKAA